MKAVLDKKETVSFIDNVKGYLLEYGIYIVFILLCIILTLANENFLTVDNVMNILRQISINGIIAVGMTFIIITGGIDLSPGSVLAFSSIVACDFAHPGQYPLIVSIIIGVGIGLLCGLANGFIIAKGKVAPFIVTLGMLTTARGLTLVYKSGRPVIDLSTSYNNIGGGYIIGIPIPVIILIVVIVLANFILKYTRFGRHVYAIGGNEVSAEVSGLNINKIKILVYGLAGTLTGLAGVILSSRVMAGTVVAGQGYELDAIAAVVIGGTSLSGGKGSIKGTVIGALIIGVMNNGLDLLNVPSYYQQIVKGVIIVGAVYFDKKNNSKN
ncbi:MAG TPA: ribose ABC transporter permease [Clostridium sp.]|uniref:ABC transporter permease n=1 Tax=Clostridium sp. TaxID=1506 RepID=UPI002F92B39D